MDWKITLLKSIIYRLITITLGFLTAYIVFGDFQTALGLSIITEAIQSINYFMFETIWNFFYEKRLLKEVVEEYLQKEIDMKLTVGSIIDIAKEFSEIDTFVPDIYDSLQKFYSSILNNKQMQEYHHQILDLKKNFEILNKGRDFDLSP